MIYTMAWLLEDIYFFGHTSRLSLPLSPLAISRGHFFYSRFSREMAIADGRKARLAPASIFQSTRCDCMTSSAIRHAIGFILDAYFSQRKAFFIFPEMAS